MTSSLSQLLSQQPQHQQLITGVEHIIRDEVTTATAMVHWDYLEDDRGRPLLVLALADHLGGKASAKFAPDELEHEHHFRERLRQLYGAMIRVGDWCSNKLSGLYNDIRQWVAAIDSNCFIQDTVVEINERLSGPYDAPALHIWRGAQVVNVRPVAIWVVAAHGRVDLIGPTDRYIWILQGNQWLAVEPTSRVDQEPLTADVFRGMFEALLT